LGRKHVAPHIYFDLGAANRHGLMEFWIKYKTIKMRHADDDPQRRGRGINIKLVIDQLSGKEDCMIGTGEVLLLGLWAVGLMCVFMVMRLVHAATNWLNRH